MGHRNAGSDVNSFIVRAFKQPFVPTGINIGVGNGRTMVDCIVLLLCGGGTAKWIVQARARPDMACHELTWPTRRLGLHSLASSECESHLMEICILRLQGSCPHQNHK